MRDVEREQIVGSTSAELSDRLAALRARYGRSGYPVPQLRELHLILDELDRRRVDPHGKTIWFDEDGGAV